MNDLSRHVALKLSRAESQIKSLCESISQWSARNPITAQCRFRDDRRGFELIQNDFPEPPPLDDWGLAAGECAHNLRSALDNLAYALARSKCDPPPKPGKLSFPIHSDKAQFVSKERNNLEQWPLAAIAVLETLQPFQRGGQGDGIPQDDPLFLLHWLNIVDKHRVPAIALIAPTMLTHNVKIEFYTSEDASLNVPPDTSVWGDALAPGVVLLQYRSVSPIQSVSGTFDGEAVVCIVRDGNPLPLGPVLSDLHYYTKLVVAQFDVFFA